MSELQRWKPWFDHRTKSPTMRHETRPNRGYVAYTDVQKTIENLRGGLDEKVQQLAAETLRNSELHKDLNATKEELTALRGSAVRELNRLRADHRGDEVVWLQEITETRDLVLELFSQACGINGIYDHMHLSAYEHAQQKLIEWRLIKEENCTRGT